jgi:hypothetical protein
MLLTQGSPQVQAEQTQIFIAELKKQIDEISKENNETKLRNQVYEKLIEKFEKDEALVEQKI